MKCVKDSDFIYLKISISFWNIFCFDPYISEINIMAF